MSQSSLSRRRFSGALGAALGGALVAPGRSAAATQAPVAPLPPSPAAAPVLAGPLIDLSSNENPYGPSAGALEAMTRACRSVACRYPDDAEQLVIDAIARHHGVPAESVVLGCGSSEILRLCDAAFLGPGKMVVAAEPTFEAVLEYAKATKAEA